MKYGRKEPRAGLVVSGHPSHATFGRLGWRRLRLEVPCGPSSRLVAGCWKYVQGGGWWVGDSRVPGWCHNLLRARSELSTAH